MNKRKTILQEIDTIKNGILFDCSCITSEGIKKNDIAVVFSELKRKGTIRRLMKGVFYKPEISSYGFGELPVDKEELIRYLTKKHNAHISGQYGYNLLGLTEQNAQTVTLAGEKPFKEFCVQKCFFSYMRSATGYLTDAKDVPLAILLDALTNIDNVSGKTGREVFQKIKKLIVNMHGSKRKSLIAMAGNYPTRTKYLLSKAMEQTNQTTNTSFFKNICNKSKYDIQYKYTILA